MRRAAGTRLLAFVRSRQAGAALCLDFRIGLNSGPVIGGVIGRDKFVFDIWGDSVNLASRMESTGVPGRVQVGPATYAVLKEQFVFEPRGRVAIKGKGEMETWFLVGMPLGPTVVAGEAVTRVATAEVRADGVSR